MVLENGLCKEKIHPWLKGFIFECLLWIGRETANERLLIFWPALFFQIVSNGSGSWRPIAHRHAEVHHNQFVHWQFGFHPCFYGLNCFLAIATAVALIIELHKKTGYCHDIHLTIFNAKYLCNLSVVLVETVFFKHIVKLNAFLLKPVAELTLASLSLVRCLFSAILRKNIMVILLNFHW